MSQKNSGQWKQKVGQQCKSRRILSRQSLIVGSKTINESLKMHVIKRSTRGYDSAGSKHGPQKPSTRVVWHWSNQSSRLCWHVTENQCRSPWLYGGHSFP